MKFCLCDTFYGIPLFHPQGDPLGVVPGPINQFYVESIFIIYGKYYIAFMSKNIFNKTCKKYMIHFMDLPVFFSASSKNCENIALLKVNQNGKMIDENLFKF